MSNLTENVGIDKEELEQAKAEIEEKESASFTHKFRKPVEYMGAAYEELTFDFDTLTGRDARAVDRELAQMGISVVEASFSTEYLIRMCARAIQNSEMNIGADIFNCMCAYDFNRIRNRARNYFMRAAL